MLSDAALGPLQHTLLTTAVRDWNEYVRCAEEVARTPDFRRLRDEILARARISPADRVLDLGAGTGLLTMAAATKAQRVWAVDISEPMCEYLNARALSAELNNVECVNSSVVSLPLVEGCVEVVISNYCFHHLDNEAKLVALEEAHRVLAPNGRLVLGDLMFSPTSSIDRNPAVAARGAPTLRRNGPSTGGRFLRRAVLWPGGRWEQPAAAQWWEGALRDVGFEEVCVESFDAEGGIATGRRR